MKNIILFLLGVSLLALTSCVKDKVMPTVVDPDCPKIISYETDIKPIINTSCVTNQGAGTGCHDAWIFNYDPIENYINLGIWQTEIFDDKTMPVLPNTWGIDALTAEEIQTMKCWIEQGYPEN